MEPSRKQPASGYERQRGGEKRRGTDCLAGVSSSRLLAVHTRHLPPRVPVVPRRLTPLAIGQVGASPSPRELTLAPDFLFDRNSRTLIAADRLTGGRNLLPASADCPQSIFLTGGDSFQTVGP